MNTRSILISLAITVICGVTLIWGSYADDTALVSETNISLNNTTSDSVYNNTILSSGTQNMTTDEMNTETVRSESVDKNQGTSDETPEMYSGTEHPNEETDVQSSTPSGDPLLNTYALGGVSIDIGAHLMEARGNDSNVSAEISLKDHTSANGYIRTIQKDFHYESKVDTPEDNWPNL